MKTKHHLFILALLAAGSCQAGAIANGSWSPSACGPKPEVASLDLKDPDAFNRSVDGVNAYRQKINVYLNCLVKEANADIQTINQAATAAQQAARAADDKIQADLKAAETKFK